MTAMIEDFSDSAFSKLSILISMINQKSHWQLEIARYQYYAVLKSSEADLEGQYFGDTIYFDRASLWDKPRKCPISINLDSSLQNIDTIIEALEWLLTEGGYTASNELIYRPKIV
jgi:hypothetical protein